MRANTLHKRGAELLLGYNPRRSRAPARVLRCSGPARDAASSDARFGLLARALGAHERHR